MPPKVTYPDNYDDIDKAMYDSLMLQAQSLLGNKVAHADSFLLDLAAKATINKMKGFKNEMSEEEMEKLRIGHKEAMNQMVHETPENLFEEGTHPLEQEEPVHNQDVNLIS